METEKWMYNNQWLEVVYTFKYLGMLFNYNHYFNVETQFLILMYTVFFHIHVKFGDFHKIPNIEKVHLYVTKHVRGKQKN